MMIMCVVGGTKRVPIRLFLHANRPKLSGKTPTIICFAHMCNLGRTQWEQLISAPDGVISDGSKGGGESHGWALVLTVGWASAMTLRADTSHTWTLLTVCHTDPHPPAGSWIPEQVFQEKAGSFMAFVQLSLRSHTASLPPYSIRRGGGVSYVDPG